jgi:phage tail sheath protein FI
VDILKSRYVFDDGQNAAMYAAQVNYTRTFVGQGTALWEQQTLSGQQSALSFLSVRRIVNVMKTALYAFAQYSLQEPNDEFSGRQIVSAFTDYLSLIKNARGISSFTVVSDASNNTAAMFNSGMRTVSVVVVPMLPIHRINLQMIISKQGVNFSETLSSLNG